MTRPRFCVLAALALVAALIVAGCGSSSSDDVGISKSQSGQKGEEAATLGEEAAGPKISLPTETVGFLNVVKASEGAARVEVGAKQAAEALGWNFVAIDGMGDPQKQATGMQSLVNQKVDVILSLGIDPSVIRQGIAAANSAGIPVFNVGGTVPVPPTDPFVGNYVASDKELGEALGEYMVENLPKDAQVAAIVTKAGSEGATIRGETVLGKLKAAGVNVVDVQPTDFTDLTGSAQRFIKSTLQAHPEVNAFFSDVDAEFPVIGQGLSNAGKCGSVQNYSFFGDLISLNTIEKGCGTAVAESPPEADGWAGIDQAAQLLARETPEAEIPKAWPELDKLYGIQFADGEAITIVDKSNLPPSGTYPKPVNDFIGFFKAKWAKEFGIEAAEEGESSEAGSGSE